MHKMHVATWRIGAGHEYRNYWLRGGRVSEEEVEKEEKEGASTSAEAGEARAKRKKEVINKQTKANKMCRKKPKRRRKQEDG